MNFDRADVVIVPALVISSKNLNDSSADAILLSITSQVHTDLQHSDYRLSLGEQKQGGLPKPSISKQQK